MTSFISSQVSALALAVVVTFATLGGLSAVANTDVANQMAAAQSQTAVAQAAVQRIVIVGHRARA